MVDWGVSSTAAGDPESNAPGGGITVKLAGHKDPPKGQAVLALRETAAQIAREWSQRLAELPVKLIEHPQYRLAGAEEAIRQVVATIEGVLERQEPFGRELSDRAAEAYGKLITFLSSVGDSRSWPRRGPSAEVILEWLRTYAKARYQSLVLQQVLSVYVSFRGCLNDELKEINFCRVRIQDMIDQIDPPAGGEAAGQKQPPASPPAGEGTGGQKKIPVPTPPAFTQGRVRHVFPEGWQDMTQAVEGLMERMSPEILMELDVRLQKMIRANFVALVHVCLGSKNATKEVASAMRELAILFVEEKLGECDVSQVFLERLSNPEQAGEELADLFEEAVPDPSTPAAARAARPPRERLVVGMPPGSAVEVLREAAHRQFKDLDMVAAQSEDDILVYREWNDQLLAELDIFGPAGQEAYSQLLSLPDFTPHSRSDVPFAPP
jgi:hypothetical protein